MSPGPFFGCAVHFFVASFQIPRLQYPRKKKNVSVSSETITVAEIERQMYISSEKLENAAELLGTAPSRVQVPGLITKQAATARMELPVAEPGTERGEGPLIQCPYCDSEAMHKLAQILLPGLAAVCVDGTTGDPFHSPSVVAVDLRREMVDYITQRSESFIADALIESEANQEGPDAAVPDDPFEAVSVFMDDFGSTKRNIIGHVSGWLLSDSRDDKIDDLVQEMEATRFWPLERREAVAETLLKNVDLRTRFHCPEKYESEARLADHKQQCSFRPVACPNDGCRARVSVRCARDHDAACPYKPLQCEQGCEKRLLRRDMDRHCVTVCPMRPMKCPFGCDSSFPDRDLEKHCAQFLRPHLIKVLKAIHKKARSEDELKDLALKLEKYDGDGKLAKALDARPLTNAVKDLEAKMKAEHSSRRAVLH
ncbi:prenyltransferase/ zinc ion binding protein [Zea mays]|uniref:TRAF-type domain-containing protein n=1 Tax=Zea mays TaxID=4577 RepID=C0HHV3_MAIZE|nr:prenyltransferase/ zinc ion binding protein [Zea mays]ACN26606.1 unknown [Zea mays]|eukprot:NP_001152220.1 prenyltransferase/ zinc ion binding protein [Zea mays]